MNYKGKHLNKKRDSVIKYGWMIASSNGKDFLFKLVKCTPFKYLYYEAIEENTNILKAKKLIEKRMLTNDTDDKHDVYEIILYDDIEVDSDEEFYRFTSLGDILKRL